MAFTIFVSTYFFGLLWYRASDYLIKAYFIEEPEERFWVVAFDLRRTTSEQDLGDLMDVTDKLVKTCYFMLTTISTVGYGD